jgi:glycosyltransferase involved in cell wall biosynthesis
MVYLSLPTGEANGWGVAGRHIARKLSALTDVTLLVSPTGGLEGLDPIETRTLSRLLPSEALWRAAEEARQRGAIHQLDGPLFIADHGLVPWMAHLRGTRTVGYTFFEHTAFAPAEIQACFERQDVLATGSQWCADVLARNGYPKATPIVQGVDLTLFRPPPDDRPREYLRDRFVIFSGGKMELRKGQDLVIRAVAALMQRHADVVLLNSWVNIWPASIGPMARSPHVRMQPPAPQTPTEVFLRGYDAWVAAVFRDNGIDPARAITLPLYANAMMPRIYHQSDIGVFPNRCEGGTNLVMMEYMACGKPVIAARATGQAEVLTDDNCLPLAAKTAGPFGPEVSVDELVERLEWAYQHRDEIEQIGLRGAATMGQFTWDRTAARIMQVLGAA